MNKILENIEEIRKLKGFSQIELCNRLGIKQQAYTHCLNKTGDMKLSMLQRIADILEVYLVDIIIYSDKYEKKGE